MALWGCDLEKAILALGSFSLGHSSALSAFWLPQVEQLSSVTPSHHAIPALEPSGHGLKPRKLLAKINHFLI